jgi:hypothetical protein
MSMQKIIKGYYSTMNHSFHLCIVAVAIIALTTCLIVETAPPAKGETGSAGRRSSRNGAPWGEIEKSQEETGKTGPNFVESAVLT